MLVSVIMQRRLDICKINPLYNKTKHNGRKKVAVIKLSCVGFKERAAAWRRCLYSHAVF